MIKNIKPLLIALIIFIYGCNFSSTKNSKRIDELIDLGVKSDSVQDFKNSIKYYTEALEFDSTKLTAITNRGRAYVWTGQVDKGFADYNKAIELYPHETTYYTRGAAYLFIKDYENAYKDFKKSIAFNPNDGEAYYGISLIKAFQGDLDSALLLCDLADKRFNIIRSSYQTRLIAYRTKGDLQAEVAELTKIIQIEPKVSYHYDCRGYTYSKLKKYKEAITDYDISIKLSPKIALTYNNRGLAKFQIKEYEGAMSDFDQAIKLDSAIPYAYNNKADLLLALNQDEDALKAVNTSLRFNDKNAYAFKNRGKIYIALKSKKKACDDFMVAAKMNQDTSLSKEIDQLINKNCK